jgi:hypothetical protein
MTAGHDLTFALKTFSYRVLYFLTSASFKIFPNEIESRSSLTHSRQSSFLNLLGITIPQK